MPIGLRNAFLLLRRIAKALASLLIALELLKKLI